MGIRVLLHLIPLTFQMESFKVIAFQFCFLYYPLSYMLGKSKGYKYGKNPPKTTDLKLYGSAINVTKKTTRPCGTIFKACLLGFWNR